ncbi:Mu-like prophage major head subunit gpT family protein [Hoeflea sp. WL0058]|uniref:Mu-like prophage major head subunit gpT family protein n=1 Tax=Flavimaribacter sediminis TaxID=2865987 RepID=A0AAE2ZJ81_9HYPH|nr:prohead protease/major capsid protein fusion protein [Flavimaribacter sediminis]MBW8636974.1 Mu-like prophage major head subunit gpT family protein [Flavimaribacter sediminis]
MPEIINRQAPQSTDVESRTAEIIWTTGAAVKRYDWRSGGYYMEMLDVSKDAIRMDRFDTMPLLDTHDNYSMETRIGTVVPGSVRIQDGKGYCKIKFSKSELGERLLQDLADGHPLNISVGYKVWEYNRKDGDTNELPTLTAIDWEPMEISAVQVPADAGAHSRKENRMPDFQTRTENSNPDIDEVIRAAGREPTEKERKRVEEMINLARSMNVDNDSFGFVQEEVRRGTSMADFRNLCLERKIEEEERTPTYAESAIGGYGDSDQRFDRQQRAMEDALYSRMSGTKPSDEARQFMGFRLEDFARGLIEAKGVNTRGMSREDLFLGGHYSRMRPAHGTSDFPNLLQGAGRRTLMAAYENSQSKLKTVIAKPSTATDFRPKTAIKISDGGPLEKVNEHGEVKSFSRSEVAESYKIDTFSAIFSLTRQALINDDLGAFTQWATTAGRKAAITEGKLLAKLLAENSWAGPTMAEDNKALFHADHNNLAGAPDGLDLDGLKLARKAFLKQTDIDGETRINISPKYLLVPTDLEVDAKQLLSTTYPTTYEDSNSFTNDLVPVVDPWLDDQPNAWYLWADPTILPVIEYSYLSGAEGPQIAVREGFDTLGSDFRVTLDFGCGAVDFRGAYRVPNS